MFEATARKQQQQQQQQQQCCSSGATGSADGYSDEQQLCELQQTVSSMRVQCLRALGTAAMDEVCTLLTNTIQYTLYTLYSGCILYAIVHTIADTAVNHSILHANLSLLCHECLHLLKLHSHIGIVMLHSTSVCRLYCALHCTAFAARAAALFVLHDSIFVQVCSLIETAAFITDRDSGSNASAVATTDTVITTSRHQLHDDADTQLVSDLQVNHVTLPYAVTQAVP
jgi:hypothetical protein